MKKILIFTLLILLALGTSAQRRRRVKTPPPPTPEELAEMARKENFERKLQAIERVTFIDSMLIKKSEIMDMLSIGSENGSVHSFNKFFNQEKEDTQNSTLFRSQLGDKIIFAQPDTSGILNLYASEMIGHNWSKRVLLSGLEEDSVNQNYPFMLSDGVTLFYASEGKESLGGYDIFMTRWDEDSQRFFKPENIGLPFNSSANDYLYVVDEFNNLGWFVTDRGQKADTVCLYCFIPNEARKIYDSQVYGHDTLVDFANINSIRDTWINKEEVDEARERLTMLKNSNIKKMSKANFSFIVNDNITYTTIQQFRHAQSKAMAEKWLEMNKELDTIIKTLDILRQQYSSTKDNTKAQLATKILPLEQRYEQLITDIYSLEKEIRSYEQR